MMHPVAVVVLIVIFSAVAHVLGMRRGFIRGVNTACNRMIESLQNMSLDDEKK